LAAINSEFFRRSIEELKKSRAITTIKLMKIYQSIYGSDNDDGHVLFRLTGHLKELSPTTLKAGFHRSNGSIFMDLFRIQPQDWMLIFTHELAHALDDKIEKALPIYADEFKSLSLSQWASTQVYPATIKSEMTEQLEEWLAAGLDLGLMAELRAWIVTIWIYRDETKIGNWSKSDWFENVLSSIQTADSFSSSEEINAVFNYLSDNSSNWPNGYEVPNFIDQSMIQMRRNLCEQSKKDLGVFESLR
jgi:hypothetical protein